MAIKNWFIEKEQIRGFYGKELVVVRETQKAVLVRAKIAGRDAETWVPKSCLCDEWEKVTSNFGYHEYLVNVYHKAYADGIIPNRIIKSGRNRYEGDAFVHQMTTKELMKSLEVLGVEYMNRTDWNNR